MRAESFCAFLPFLVAETYLFVMSLVLIMGLPAAGKSTLASKLLEYRPNSTLFSLDEINGRWSNDFEAHKDRKAFEQKIRLHLEEKCGEKFDGWVIVDDNFHLQSMRRPFKRMARAFGLQYCCVLVEIDVQEALQRNSKRGEDRVSEETIIKMSREMEIPEDALVYRNQGIEEIIEVLSRPRPKRVTKQALPCSQPSQSVLSEMDQLLRFAVSEAVREGLDGRILAVAKKAVMNRCRQSENALHRNEIRKLLLEKYFAIMQRQENGNSQ